MQSEVFPDHFMIPERTSIIFRVQAWPWPWHGRSGRQNTPRATGVIDQLAGGLLTLHKQVEQAQAHRLPEGPEVVGDDYLSGGTQRLGGQG